MTDEEIIEYVMNSPENTNPSVLDSMLKSNKVQPDWNQNDENAANYIKNRPFYTGNPVETVFADEITLQFSLDGGKPTAGLPTSFNAEFGQTYKNILGWSFI